MKLADSVLKLQNRCPLFLDALKSKCMSVIVIWIVSMTIIVRLVLVVLVRLLR
jgi:hypothetical protein